MVDASPSQLVDKVSREARRLGFGITAGLTVQDYNACVDHELALPDMGRSSTLAVVVGSTREIWKPFLREMLSGRLSPDEKTHEGPLNTFVVQAIDVIVAAAVPRHVQVERRYAHEVAMGRLVSMQHLAHVAGIAYHLRECSLSIHPEYGPWHSYRAVVVIDCDGVPSAGPCMNPATPTECENALRALAEALAATNDPKRTNSGAALSKENRAVWRKWQRVRLAIRVGTDWRYSDEEDEYHYCWDPAILRRMLLSLQRSNESADTPHLSCKL